MRTLLNAFPSELYSGEDPFLEFVETVGNRLPDFIVRVVDGGAGIGSFTDRMLRALPDCEITAYEPLPENAKILRSRFSNIPSVDAREAALGDKPATVLFAVPERVGMSNNEYWVPGTTGGGFVSRPGPVAVMKSKIPPTAKNFVKKLLGRGTLEYEKVPVQTVRLDSELGVAPDLVKLDLQGGEPEALEGLGSLLPQVKMMKIEVILRGEVEGRRSAKNRAVGALADAGFSFFVEEFALAAPGMTDELRRALGRHGLNISSEVRLHESHSDILIKGAFSSEQPTPIQNRWQSGKFKAIAFTPEFDSVLSDAQASSVGVDLIALNGRYAEQWKSVLPPELLQRSGMVLAKG